MTLATARRGGTINMGLRPHPFLSHPEADPMSIPIPDGSPRVRSFLCCVGICLAISAVGAGLLYPIVRKARRAAEESTLL